jgi:hypothetical protein
MRKSVNCDDWIRERRSPSPKNPNTNRKIRVNGPVYKKLDKYCKDLINTSIETQTRREPSVQKNNTETICDEWIKQRNNPNPRNPRTDRVLKKNGPKYNQLDEECDKYLVDMDSVCVQWLKDNHYDLYIKLNKKQRDDKPSTSRQYEVTQGPSLQNTPIAGPSSTSSLLPSTVIQPEKRLNLFYTTEVRIEEGITIKEYFSYVIIEDGKACMTLSKTLLRHVDNPQVLGYNSYGTIYDATIPQTLVRVIIEERRIDSFEFEKAMKKEYPISYLYNKLINDLIDDKTCPNFTYTYAIFFCDKCALQSPSEDTARATTTTITYCSETVMERFDYAVDKLTNMADGVILSILFQLFFALSSIQLKYGMFHSNIKKENILIKTIPSGGYWKYNLDGKSYYVPNYGYIAALNDCGNSFSYMPGISLGDYGRRQAKVYKDSLNDIYYFYPFTTEFYPYIEKDGTVKQVKSYRISNTRNLTQNFFYKDFSSLPSIPIELQDMDSFPVHYFNYDIVDLIFTFIGGKRTLQRGNHTALNVSQDIHRLFKDFYKVSINEAWPMNRVDLFLASHAIRKIFSFYLNSDLNGPELESYSL